MAMVNADEHCFKNGTAAVTGRHSPYSSMPCAFMLPAAQYRVLPERRERTMRAVSVSHETSMRAP